MATEVRLEENMQTTRRNIVRRAASRGIRVATAAVRTVVGHNGEPAVWRGGLEAGRALSMAGREVPRLTKKYRDELAYWVEVGVNAERMFTCPYPEVFRHWQAGRMGELAEFLELDPSAFTQWCAARTAIEIGAGPFPSIAMKAWRRAVAIDPLADGYAIENLLPPECDGVVYMAAQGEFLPLASKCADIIVIENCLDHVDEPPEVLKEVVRLLRADGLLWLLVDLMDYRDHLHPNPFSEQSLRALLADFGFDAIRERTSPHKSHPQAYGEYRGLLRKRVA